MHNISSYKKPSTLISRVAKAIEANCLAYHGDRIIVAVSGGGDSTALLHVLRQLELNLQLIAVYIDHGIRPDESINEINQLVSLCRLLEIPFQAETICVNEFAQKEKKSFEDAARTMRYEVLQRICTENSAQAIATGHTADDQVEEFFIRLIRGSSSKGLAGMEYKRDNIIRPLLSEEKQTLVEYLNINSIAWSTDSSNHQRKYLRNRVRLDLLPLLKRDFNPSINRNVLQSMDILATEDHFLETTTRSVFAGLIEKSKKAELQINSQGLLDQHPAIQRRIIEKCCWQVSVRPSYKHIKAILNLLTISSEGSELHLGSDIQVTKKNQTLVFTEVPQLRNKKKGAQTIRISQDIPCPGTYPFEEVGKALVVSQKQTHLFTSQHHKTRLYVDASTVDFPLKIQSAAPGDRFHPYNSCGHRKVLRYLTDQKIKANQKHLFPLLWSNLQIVAILGIQIDSKHKITASTKSILELAWIDLE